MAVVMERMFKSYFLISVLSVHNILRVYDLITFFIPRIEPFKGGCNYYHCLHFELAAFQFLNQWKTDGFAKYIRNLNALCFPL